MNDVTIKRGFTDAQREQSAHLYYNAFRQKLHPIFRDEARALRVLSHSLDPDYALTAVLDGQVVGIAGFHDEDGNLVDIDSDTMVKTFGFFGGWWRLLALSLFSRKVQAGVLLMDGIAVDESMRGRGIGSRLLNAVVDHAKDAGYDTVRLDVVDTNPRAQQLYERKGFVAINTEHYPYLRRIFGFGASTTMHKDV